MLPPFFPRLHFWTPLLAEELRGPLAEFSVRASSPSMHFESAAQCRGGKDLRVRGPEGRQCRSAVAVLEG
ncbi:hypothetical protein [Leisingera thetidis]|uniref:hypothetical protein n=1 Tax=Leisingera thetidis TaxID=2930199 RepID=UPI0021F7F761|nr:hypothetical protein [Leisingera thetidis]